jgi:hypothetical protein
MRVKITKKTTHYKLELKSETKNNETFIKDLGKKIKIIRTSIKS